MFYLSKENVLSSWYNVFQRARWEIRFKSFKIFQLFLTVSKISQIEVKRACLFDWSMLLCPHGNSVSKKFAVIEECLCYYFGIEVPLEWSWSKCQLLCTFCGVTDKKWSYDHNVWFSLHNIKLKEYCLFNSVSYL